MYLTYDKMLHVSSVKIYAAFQKKGKNRSRRATTHGS